MSKEGNAISFAGNLTDTPRCATLTAGSLATFWVAVSGRWDGEALFFTVVSRPGRARRPIAE